MEELWSKDEKSFNTPISAASYRNFRNSENYEGENESRNDEFIMNRHFLSKKISSKH